MKIKNIRQYREFYKSIRPVDASQVDEHFIGNFHDKEEKRKYGWFALYHGDKEGYGNAEEGIGNFLSSFLDMAKDGQAVYEFLQNAVDAGASHFTMAWGKDEIDGNNYLLIANNGDMFNFDSVRSILNVGSSTKTADSQNIGKFGIGFKLAHRLVGKDNGLEELLNNNQPSGPILFSWQNRELGALASGSNPEPQPVLFKRKENQNYLITDNNPWLFKILITCFPALPENTTFAENIRLSDGTKITSPVFNQSEYQTLCRWVNNYREYLNDEIYEQGALFFIKLGTGKENDLADKNLAEGVRFSLAILQETAEEEIRKKHTLQTVQLNREAPIKKPSLNYLYFEITKAEHLSEYIYIRFGVRNEVELTSEQKAKLSRESDIEVLFGFRDYDSMEDYFKGAPNFYLYFPLSEEVHNFNFVLHSNAFYKASSRTFLHKGTTGEDGINERLLKTIANRLEDELLKLYKSDNPKDKKNFLNLYASLLTSSESSNYERQWVKEPFINEITRVLKRIVPVKENNTDEFTLSSTQPRIKTTAVNLPLEAYGMHHLTWFYWGAEAPDLIRYKAIEKLHPLVFDIFQLLSKEGISIYVNNWIEEDKSRIEIILKELDKESHEKVRSEHFKQNLKNLKIFEFSDSSLLSDNELVEKQDDGYIVLHNKLEDTENELQKIGIKTTKISLDSYQFFSKYAPYLSPDSQLRSQAKLIEIVSNSDTQKLNSQEKLNIFWVFRNMIEEGRRSERLGELKLFKNKLGNCVKIKNILRSTEIPWLKPFLMDKSEQHVDVDRYLLRDKTLIYENIIYAFWSTISQQLMQKDPEDRYIVFDQIKQYYEESKYSADEELQLTDEGGIFFKGIFSKTESPYFNEILQKIDSEKYSQIQDIVDDKLGLQIPDEFFLSVHNQIPFLINSPNKVITKNQYIFNPDEIHSFLRFCSVCNINLFADYSVYKNEERSYHCIRNDISNYFTENKKIKKYIEKYLGEVLLQLPETLNGYSKMVPLQGMALAEFLIEKSNCKNEEQKTDLIEALLQEDEETLARLFKALDELPLDLTWEDEKINEVVLGLIKRLLSGDKIERLQLQAKIIFKEKDSQFLLNSIDSANDDVIVHNGTSVIKLSRTLILGLEDDGAIRKILVFADEATNRELLTRKEATRIFRIESGDVTEELIKHFEKNLSDGQLRNAHQLILVLLSSHFGHDTLNKFKVRDAAGKWQKLKDNWVLPGIPTIEFYDKEYVLAEDYNSLATLLKLKEKEVFYYGKNNASLENEPDEYIIPFFLFQRGSSSKVLNTEIHDIKKLKYLFGRWHLTPHEQRINKDKEPWEEIFSFNPRLSIYSDFILESEKLNNSILDWVKENEQDRISFLRALGVQTNGSDIARLRKWFMDSENQSIIPVSIAGIPTVFLSNTLVGLADGFFEQTEKALPFKANSQKHHQINEIILTLLNAGENKELRIPVWYSNELILLGNQQGVWPYFLEMFDYEILIKNANAEVTEKLFESFQVIVHNEEYLEFVRESYEQLVIYYYFIEPEDFTEHDEPFYKSWLKKYGIQLFRIPKIEYGAFAKTRNDEIFIGKVSFADYYLDDEHETNKKLYYRSDISLEALKSSLVEDEKSDLADWLEELINDRNKMLAAFYNTLTASGKDEFDNEDTKLLLESLKERNKDEQRNEIVEDIKTNERYSYNWFKSYINYLLTFEEIADTTDQKSISFQSIEPYSINGKKSDKYFILRGANSMIPMNIEAFEDFSINLVFRSGLKVNIIVEGVSKKGQDLLTYIPKGIESKFSSNFSQVVNIKINFSPNLDLVQRLYDVFTNEKIITPWENIQEAMQPLHFIYGPPGTGKTTKICKILKEEYLKNPIFKVLVLVPTNKAGDVLAKKLIVDNVGLSVIRIGSATDPELEQLDEDIYQVSLNDLVFDGANVIISTIHRFPYYKISKEHGAHFKLFEKEALWDLVIFDESSMISLPYIVFALLSLKEVNSNTNYLVAGDPKQIPAIVDTSDKNLESLNLDDESIYKMLNIHSFDKEEQEKTKRKNDIIENLNTQFRSIEAIGKLFSEFSYEDLLYHGRNLSKEPRKTLPENFIDTLNNPVSLINFSIDHDTSVLQPRKLLYSSYHVYAGILASEIVKFLNNCNTENTNYSIGVISPYKAQALLMNKLIVASGISKNLQIKCDTVHGFQGDQCDIIILVINPNNHYYTGHKNSLLSKEYVYNVAISRARDYLWILNPFHQIKNNPHMQNMQEILGNNASIISSKYIEKILFGDSDFIVQNSYLTGHDNINVFGQVDMKYFIKAGNTAIDIQLRK
ncbi:AAA domain-containing protein [Marinilabilia rubra]|uniref:Uncharacterized protein n=1 Tax=Marinilabilia rubra TaxID=2162893 RepID=A0A2U2B6T8_9BACT|nr:AAA domain-containing protein [Marinilabilia rubra]PWD98788.1 hypothetical protein DDZ16_13700 [Marinilabilia rubra]